MGIAETYQTAVAQARSKLEKDCIAALRVLLERRPNTQWSDIFYDPKAHGILFYREGKLYYFDPRALNSDSSPKDYLPKQIGLDEVPIQNYTTESLLCLARDLEKLIEPLDAK